MKVKTFGPGYSDGVDRFIGIDQSYTGFGVTVLGSDNSYLTTVAKFDGTGVNRLVDIKDYLQKIVWEASQGGEVVATAMEGYAYGSQMANMAGELGATVKIALYESTSLSPDAAYPLIVPPTTLKKYVTGRGNSSSKSQIMLNIYKKWQVELLDDNAADSFGLAHIISNQASLSYEKEVVELLKDIKYREKQYA